MVAKKTLKSCQLSYAERVLGALTQVQREHRKQLIHVATLRAQVKKNAVKNKEKLGPRWSSWVGNAIRKLEENGILEFSPTVGNVLLTAFGKKAISDARQSLSAMINTPPMSVPEHMIWKHLTHTTPTIHAKQGRPSIRRNHDDLDRIADARFKRRRISTVLVSPPNFQYPRMTKLELEEKLRMLQKEKENGLWLRQSSPLTDLDMEEEAERLRNELKEKQYEIERITQELLEAKRVLPSNQSYRQEMHTRPSSPVPPNSKTSMHSGTLSLGRTQSGSCMSLFSRQLTPPRSPGAISDAIFDTTGTQEDGFVATSEVTSTSTDSRILDLERDVASQVVIIENLEAKLSKLQEKFAAAQRAISERDGQLSTLSINLVKLQTDASQKALDLGQQSAELRELKNLKANLESAQSSRLAVLEHELNERNILIKAISQDREKDIAELASLRESHSTVQKYGSELAEQLRAADVKLQSQSSANKELEGKVEASLATISALNQEIRALQQSKNTTDTLLLEARKQQTLASEKVQEADARIESLSHQLMMTMDEKSERQAALDVFKDCFTTLNTHLSTTAKGKWDVILSPQLADTASALQSEFATSKQSSADLVHKLVAIMDERVMLLSELDKARATSSASASSAAQFEDRLITTTDDLIKTKDIAAEFQAKLNATIDKLTFEQEQKHALIAEIELKHTELALSAQRLSVAESMTEKYQTEVVAHRLAVQELQERMSATQDELKAARDLLSSTQNEHILEKQKQSTRILDLEALAQREGTEIDNLQLRLSSTCSEKEELQKKLEAKTSEFEKLIFESRRAIHLQTELSMTTEKLQEAEEELLDLRSSKAADEVTIETMKEMFSTHVEKQTQSLAVFNSQIISTKSSPAPKRRSTRTIAKAPVPFKLT